MPIAATVPCMLTLLSLCMQNESWGAACASNDPNAETITLETVRKLAARNEALIDPIRLTYTIEVLYRDRSRAPVDPRASVGRPVWQTRVSWARRGSKQYLRASDFHGPNEPGRSTETILDELVRTQTSLPDRMSAGISHRRLTDEHDAADDSA